MTDEAEIVILSDWKLKRAEYNRRKTERHKRKLLRDAKACRHFPAGSMTWSWGTNEHGRDRQAAKC